MNTLLTDQTAIIYGAAGGPRRRRRLDVRARGATVYLAGRTRSALEQVAAAIAADGGTAHVAVVDALDEAAVTDHAQAVVDRAGGVDVSFNLTSRGDVQGTPLLDMDVEDFLAPIVVGARSEFITARAAALHMVNRGAGVILMVTSGSGAVLKSSPNFNMGGTGPADAATESFMHYLAGEVGPRGVRVAGLWTAGVFYSEQMAGLSMLGRGPTLDQFADTAAFVASEHGSGITASIINVSSGVSAH